MGQCCSTPSSATSPSSDSPYYAQQSSSSPRVRTSTSGSGSNSSSYSSGSRLGGDEIVASLGPRTAAAMAAEARAAARAPMEDKLRKEDLLGKLTEIYKRKRIDVPFGLPSLSVQQLLQKLEEMREKWEKETRI